ncbi:MAG: hypothetical protein ACREBK_02595 [Sphingomicrobium sp.]
MCRTQLWQWLKFEAPFDGRRRFTPDLFEDWLAEELAALGNLPNLKPAARLLHELVAADEFEEFLTLPAYELLTRTRQRADN